MIANSSLSMTYLSWYQSTGGAREVHKSRPLDCIVTLNGHSTLPRAPLRVMERPRHHHADDIAPVYPRTRIFGRNVSGYHLYLAPVFSLLAQVSVICSKTDRGLGLFLGIWFFLQHLDSLLGSQHT